MREYTEGKNMMELCMDICHKSVRSVSLATRDIFVKDDSQPWQMQKLTKVRSR
jgi:hypothetical protein